MSLSVCSFCCCLFCDDDHFYVSDSNIQNASDRANLLGLLAQLCSCFIANKLTLSLEKLVVKYLVNQGLIVILN